MRERRIQRLLTIDAVSLGNNRDNSHKDPEKTVLEDTYPDDLNPRYQLGDSVRYDMRPRIH